VSVALGAVVLDPLGLLDDVVHQIGMAIGEVRAQRVEGRVGERLELAVPVLIRHGGSVAWWLRRALRTRWTRR
jgi:hypothetical protein